MAGVAAVWFVGNLIPYAIIGPYWGLVWFLINMPVSLLAEATVGIGSDSIIEIAIVTAVNGLILGAIAQWVVKRVQAWRGSRPPV